MRHAIYWLPEADHPLWVAGCTWLGRDPALAATGQPPPHRAEPWRYGFHATLKPPFRLKPGRAVGDLLAAARALAASIERFETPPWAVDELDGFLALRPTAPCPALQALADRCVVELDALRAPLPAAEAERRAQGIDAAHRERVARWGYPHVLSGWRAHLTLTDRLSDPTVRDRVRLQAQEAFAAALALAAAVASISVLVEAAPGEPLRLVARLPLRDQRAPAG